MSLIDSATVENIEASALRLTLPSPTNPVSPPQIPDEAHGLALTADERRWLASLPPIKLGIDPDWAPIAYIDANGRPSGIVADYLAYISKSLGIRFALVKTKSGRDLVPGAIR